jgi:hypothetical protein
MAIEVDQQVLEPLAKLRGVELVKVVGRITDEWAEFLKRSIESGVGADVGALKHSIVPR